MGTWFVIGVKPTLLERTCSNAVERYSLVNNDDNNKDHDVDIDFQYNKVDPITSPLKSLPQKGWLQGEDKMNTSKWKVSPAWPIKMPYLILETDKDSSDYCVIGFPSRAYCWIMSRTPQMADNTYSMLVKKLEEKHQYNLDGLRKVPQKWTKEEREKRGLTANEIPDRMLSLNWRETSVPLHVFSGVVCLLRAKVRGMLRALFVEKKEVLGTKMKRMNYELLPYYKLKWNVLYEQKRMKCEINSPS